MVFLFTFYSVFLLTITYVFLFTIGGVFQFTLSTLAGKKIPIEDAHFLLTVAGSIITGLELL